MTMQTMDQAALTLRQKELDAAKADTSAKLFAQQRELGKAVAEKLAGVPMHATNIGETALVCAAVLKLLGMRGSDNG